MRRAGGHPAVGDGQRGGALAMEKDATTWPANVGGRRGVPVGRFQTPVTPAVRNETATRYARLSARFRVCDARNRLL